MSATAQELLQAGDPRSALKALEQDVRRQAGDPKLRVFLFQLLCVLSQWPRALAQLAVCGELDAATLAMVNTYREAVKCELVREAVFAGRTTPMLLAQPRPWMARLVQALRLDAEGDPAGAARLRAQALDEAEPAAGSLDGQPFEWIADADSRLGPVLEVIVNGRYAWVPFADLRLVRTEAPADLRDLVWLPAHLDFPNGGDAVALIPARYPATPDQAPAALLSRSTEWLELGEGQYAGVGQRVLCTDAGEHDLLQLRRIEIGPEAGA
ncbi:type VI secretion system accessory protein TagJ [Azohydromonas caseinilytica]|uniref:Virulence protein SciE type n=1 Tax=Azohydromonas caseinilytica TaxID=2728836 RepID=A0A848FDU4_9BURK|nr:type VI secretion system accessory protein TagJ [Azohydromonas caseinilytica]NML16549.1 virulence protein SciE type [Azohydromonas caseinilytica]